MFEKDEYRYIGKSVPRVDTKEKVTGEALYAGDFKFPRMLHARLVKSPYPHARILGIDTSKAERVPGVRAVATAKDTSGKLWGIFTHDQPIFAIDRVRFAGEVVAAVAAETLLAAEEAADLVEVKYEELPAVFDAEEAMKKEAPVLHPDKDKYVFYPSQWVPKLRQPPDMPNVFEHWIHRSGDIEKAFKEADLIVENRYELPRTSVLSIQTLLHAAWWEPDGTLVFYSTAQDPHLLKLYMAEYFEIPPSKIRVYCPFIGGGFGGKAVCFLFQPIPAILARKAGRPVRLQLTRPEFLTYIQRPKDIITLKDGFKKDGTLVARQVKTIQETGASCSKFMENILAMAPAMTFGYYRAPNCTIDAYGVYTNLPMTSTQRGVEDPQYCYAFESQMDIAAEKLGISPIAIREKNFLNEGEKAGSGEVMQAVGAKDCLRKAAEWIEWDKKPVDEPGPWKKGKGICCGCHWTAGGSGGNASVRVRQDGAVEVRCGAVELGQGWRTVATQIVAEEFAIPMEQVIVTPVDTDSTPMSMGTWSSRETMYEGLAVIKACREAKQKVYKLAAPKLGTAPEELDMKEGKVFVKSNPEKSLAISHLFHELLLYAHEVGEIWGSGMHDMAKGERDFETGICYGDRDYACWAYGAYGVEVAVNVETGEVRLLKIGGAFDAGQPINPKMCEGQIEGGAVMGVGNVMYEESKYDRGVMINPTFLDYKVPTMADVPSGANFETFPLDVTKHKDGPYGAKGLGESTLVAFLPAVCSAVYNAVGVRIKQLPISREHVLKAIKEKK